MALNITLDFETLDFEQQLRLIEFADNPNALHNMLISMLTEENLSKKSKFYAIFKAFLKNKDLSLDSLNLIWTHVSPVNNTKFRDGDIKTLVEITLLTHPNINEDLAIEIYNTYVKNPLNAGDYSHFLVMNAIKHLPTKAIDTMYEVYFLCDKISFSERYSLAKAIMECENTSLKVLIDFTKSSDSSLKNLAYEAIKRFY